MAISFRAAQRTPLKFSQREHAEIFRVLVWKTSHQLRTCFCKLGTFAAIKRDVGDKRLTFQPVSRVNEAVAAAVDIRIINLRRVPNEDEF